MEGSNACGDRDKDDEWVDLWPNWKMSKEKPCQGVVVSRFNRLRCTFVQIHVDVNWGQVDVPRNLNVVHQ